MGTTTAGHANGALVHQRPSIGLVPSADARLRAQEAQPRPRGQAPQQVGLTPGATDAPGLPFADSVDAGQHIDLVALNGSTAGRTTHDWRNVRATPVGH